MPDTMSEDTPNKMLERMPDDMLDRMPENLLVIKYINVMVGIIRNKIFKKKLFFLMDIIWLIFDKIKKIFEINYFILNIYIFN